MAEIKGLTINETDENGRTTYEPVVATVTRFSDFNVEHFALSDIDGFWSLAPRLKDKIGVPPKGTKALWTLVTKPKTDPRAKPGSVYMDVIAVEKVPDSYQEPERAAPAAGAPWGKQEVTSDPKGRRVDRPARPQMDRDTSIVTQVAFIRLTELLAAGKLPMYEGEPPVLTNWGADWNIFYEAMKRGGLPAWPERDSTVAELPDDGLPAGLGWGDEPEDVKA